MTPRIAGARVALGLIGAALAIGLTAIISGCTPAQVAQTEAAAAKLCAYDAVGQPIVGTLAAGIADPTVQVVVQADNTIVHPFVVKACAALPKPSP